MRPAADYRQQGPVAIVPIGDDERQSALRPASSRTPPTVGARAGRYTTSGQEVMKRVVRLWGFGVHLESTNVKGDVTKRWSVPAPATA